MFLLDDSRQQLSSAVGNKLLNLRAAAIPKSMTTTDTKKRYDSIEEALKNTRSRSRINSGSKKERPTPNVLFPSSDQADYVRNEAIAKKRPAPKSLFTTESSGPVIDPPMKRKKKAIGLLLYLMYKINKILLLLNTAAIINNYYLYSSLYYK